MASAAGFEFGDVPATLWPLQLAKLAPGSPTNE